METQRSWMGARLMLGAVVLVGLAGAAQWWVGRETGEPPAVFAKQSYEEALKVSAEKKSALIVKGTASWCGPCKQMDRTTWVDARVVEWVKQNGAAIALDVDAEPKLAQSLKISAMPTMVYYKSGIEVDRVVGYRSADQLLAWVKQADAGKAEAKGPR